MHAQDILRVPHHERLECERRAQGRKRAGQDQDSDVRLLQLHI